MKSPEQHHPARGAQATARRRHAHPTSTMFARARARAGVARSNDGAPTSNTNTSHGEAAKSDQSKKKAPAKPKRNATAGAWQPRHSAPTYRSFAARPARRGELTSPPGALDDLSITSTTPTARAGPNGSHSTCKYQNSNLFLI